MSKKNEYPWFRMGRREDSDPPAVGGGYHFNLLNPEEQTMARDMDMEFHGIALIMA